MPAWMIDALDRLRQEQRPQMLEHHLVLPIPQVVDPPGREIDAPEEDQEPQ